MEVAVALVAVADQHEVVPVVFAARHARVLARLVLPRLHAQRAVEPVGNLQKKRQQNGNRQSQLLDE